MGSFQTGVCMWVEISDRSMHMGNFQTCVFMWVVFRHVYACG